MNVLIMLPESLSISSLLCKYVFDEHLLDEIDLLILKKQKLCLARLIEDYKFREVYLLEEEYYGCITSKDAERLLGEKVGKPYDVTYFPFTTFMANIFLFAGTLSNEVRAANASLYGKKYMPIIKFRMEDENICKSVVPWEALGNRITETKDSVVSILEKNRASIGVSGERPTLGILEGFAHDMEIFCRYAFSAAYVKNKQVMDIGGGLGYGSFLLSQFAKEVVLVDPSEEVVRLVKDLWCEESPNLKTSLGNVMDLNFSKETFDVVVFMDIVEHLADPGRALLNLHSLLKDDGLLIVSTPQPEMFPYSVCPESRCGEHQDDLLAEGIWPWHIQGLGEEVFIPLLNKTGFAIEEKNYMTYIKGYEIKRCLRGLLKSKDLKPIIKELNKMTMWSLSDFGITSNRDPYFSAHSYNVVAKKVND